MANNFNVDDLKKIEVLGQGGFGKVWKVRYGSKFAALKVCEDSDEEDVAKEGRILSRLKHRNIVSFIGLSKDKDALLLEYVGYNAGDDVALHSLRDYIGYVGKMSDIKDYESSIPYIACEILQGLAYLHSQGLAHRDLKPGNVLVGNGNENELFVKLTDFGEAWANLLENSVRTHTVNACKGTNIFMAPEIIARKEKKSEIKEHEMQIADIWGFGLICSCLLNLNPLPYSEELSQGNVKRKDIAQFIHDKILEKKVPVNSEKFATRSWEVIRRAKEVCLVHDPQNRASVEQLGRVFDTELDLYQPIRLKIHQGSALEFAQSESVESEKPFVLPPNDGSGCCAFLSAKICMDWNRIDMEKRSNPKTIAPLVEDIISNYPSKVNEMRNLEKRYTVEEVLPLLNNIEGTVFQYIDMADGADICSEEGNKALLNCLKDIDGAGILTCEPYSFVIGNSLGQAFTIDTHSIPYHIGGDGNGVIVTFPSHQACIKWIQRRLETTTSKTFHVAVLQEKSIDPQHDIESTTRNTPRTPLHAFVRPDESDEVKDYEGSDDEMNGCGSSPGGPSESFNDQREIILIDDDCTAEDIGEITEPSGQEYYKDDLSLPIYRSGRKKYVESKEAAKVLLKGVPTERVCTTPPQYIVGNYEFVVDTSGFGNWRDIQTNLSDLVKTGTRSKRKAPVIVVWKGISYKVTRFTYYHKQEPTFKKLIVRVTKTDEEQPIPHFYVQYYFIGSPKPIIFPNKKKTNFSVREDIRNMVSSDEKISPKVVFTKICEKNGGFENAKSCALPISCQQISDIKRRVKQKSGQADEVIELIDMCNMQKQTQNPFLREVLTAPELSVFVASNRQLNDIKRFSVDSNTSVVGIDPTYNICGNNTTLVTTRNPTLVVEDTDIHPVLLGPALLHSQKTEESYYTLPSEMVRKLPALANVRLFGTDGEAPLYSACKTVWRDADHLLCWVHSKDNAMKKLSSLQMSEEMQERYMKEIYGEKVGETKVKGLGDSESKEEFVLKFSQLEERWRNDGEKGQAFLEYFVRCKRDMVRDCMIASVREKCGLGSPPKEYDQNGNECYNSVLKRAKGKSILSLKETIALLKAEVDWNDLNIRLALCGRGKFRIAPMFRDKWELTQEKYDRMQQAEKDRYLEKFLEIKIPMNGAIPKLIQEKANVANECDLVSSISVAGMPLSICKEIQDGANVLLKTQSNIVEGPAASEKVYLYNEHNNKNPFTVCRPQETGKQKDLYLCDVKLCRRFKMHQFCEHTCAVAKQDGRLEPFLKKLSTRKSSVTKVANASKDQGAGRKANKATMRRKGPANTIPVKILRYEEPPSSSTSTLTQQPGASHAFQPIPDTSFNFVNAIGFSPNQPTQVVGPSHSYTKAWVQPSFSPGQMTCPEVMKHNPQVGQYIVSPLSLCDSRVKQCSGCHKHLDTNPATLVVVSKGLKDRFIPENRQYVPGNEIKNLYFHWDAGHVRLLDPNFQPSQLEVPAYVVPHLNDRHKQILRQMNLTIPTL